MPRRLESVGDRIPAKWEPAADRGLWALSDPRLSNPSQDEEECCYGQKNFGKYSSLSLSTIHLSHTTNITFLRIKCEMYIFIKKCIRSLIEVRKLYLIMFLLIFVLWLYNNKSRRPSEKCLWWIVSFPMSGSFKNSVGAKSIDKQTIWKRIRDCYQDKTKMSRDNYSTIFGTVIRIRPIIIITFGSTDLIMHKGITFGVGYRRPRYC